MAGKVQQEARVLSNEQVASGIFMLSAHAPKIAALAAPGQFVHVRVCGPSVQFLRMPFAVCDADAESGRVDVCYQVVGEGTEQLSGLACGDELDMIGPIGNGWSWPEGISKALLIAGGVGAPAINMLGSALAHEGVQVDFVLGAQSADKFVLLDRMQDVAASCGGSVHVTTDDGSKGVHGFVTAASDGLISSGAYGYVAVCGPTPMMANAVKPALAGSTPCQVSMEKLMACGVGACLSCVVDTLKGRRRCCVDGPIFDAGEVVW